MIAKVGYACVNEHLKPAKFRSCRLKTVKEKGINHLRDIILHNIDHTYNILEWNVAHHIRMYRVSSDLMPLVTHPDILAAYDWRWYKDHEVVEGLYRIHKFARQEEIRLSMHPDQYTVLNSPKEEVVKNSIDYLEYHAKLLSIIGGKDMIVHVGGVYGDKECALKRFVATYIGLSDEIKSYLRLENDDKSYNIFEVLELSDETGIPVVFDLHHHRCLMDVPISHDLLDQIERTWSLKTPKIHISSGKTGDKDRSHHDFISAKDCRSLCKLYGNRKVDVMVEAKKKEYAALGVMDYIRKGKVDQT